MRGIEDRVEEREGAVTSTGGGMWWVAWRLNRARLATSGVALLVISAMLALTRVLADRAAAAVEPFTPACQAPVFRDGREFCSTNPGALDWAQNIKAIVELALVAAPIVMAVFLGASLVAQERERGTAVLALTQSTSRARWLLTGVTVLLVPLVPGWLLVGQLADWAMDAELLESQSVLATPSFNTQGLVPAALFLLVFGVAVAVGTLFRSVVPAVLVASLVGGAPALLISYDTYQHFASVNTQFTPYPSTDTDVLDVPSGSVRQLWSFVDSDGRDVDVNVCYSRSMSEERVYAEQLDECFAEFGVTQMKVTYLPVDRYSQIVSVLWAICAVVAATGLLFSLWRLRRIRW